jgi:hypothetical protein
MMIKIFVTNQFDKNTTLLTIFGALSTGCK